MKPYECTAAAPALLLWLLVMLPQLCCGLAQGAPAQPGSSRAQAPDLAVYTDTLASGWEDWSYGGITVSSANTSPVHGGADSISVTYTGGWSGYQIGYHGANLDVSAYDTFRFWIHGGSSGGQNIQLQIGTLEQPITPQAGTWTRVDVSLVPLGSPRTVYSITWFNNTAGSQAAFYLDDIAFVDNGTTPPPPPPPEAGPALRGAKWGTSYIAPVKQRTAKSQIV
jgi:hypothetical protein